ncbi:2,5-diamino-6-(ribosylamino)-4(3H)-pyrimidinone 5'-phosphate reductase [Methanosarcinales archaeon]|nr:MAG: 2,5-diamino-6-(ribosylamino)-4(3H)-pyrimidinone 5'-phosphate reductase [Methanosarcinales archaeon]
MSLPRLFINAAMSADGKIASHLRKQFKLSGKADFARVDRLRAENDAIMVGIGTLLADDSSLTVKSEKLRERRLQKGLVENPARIVVDSRARTPLNADLFKKGLGERIIITSQAADKDKIERLQERATILTAGYRKVNLRRAVEELGRLGYQRIMVEGGATLNWSLIHEGLVSEIYTFISNQIIGGATSPTLVDGTGYTMPDETTKLRLISAEPLDNGILLRWQIQK